MNSCMNSYMRIWIHTQNLLDTSEFICFFHDIWIHDFPWIHIFFHELIYELTAWIQMWTLLGSPKFMVFHEFMQDMMYFGLFSWERIREIIVKIMSEEYREEYHEEYREFMKFEKEFSFEFISTVHGRAVSVQCADAQCLTGFSHPAAGAPEPSAPLSAGLLAELKCQYLPPRSYHTLSSSSGCQSCTNLNFVT